MSHYTLGVDTSNYATSLAVFDAAGEVVCAKKRFLPVKAGQLGLRQSDALFHHTVALPEMMQELANEFDLTKIDAVGVSPKPRPAEGSYMPCFLAGECAARCMAAALGVSARAFSHQQGHLAAAAFSVGQPELLRQPFLAWHLSGGTTELLLVQPDPRRILRAEILGGSTDLSAGQIIDRVGVALGLPFPAGPYVEQAALRSASEEWFPVKVQACRFSFSGVQNQYQKRMEAGEGPEDLCRFVLQTVAHAILRATLQARRLHPGLPVLVSGGVSVCSLVQQCLQGQKDLWFAAQGLGGDNGVGAAILAAME